MFNLQFIISIFIRKYIYYDMKRFKKENTQWLQFI